MKKGVPSVYLVWRVSLDLGLPGDGVRALSITLQSGRQLCCQGCVPALLCLESSAPAQQCCPGAGDGIPTRSRPITEHFTFSGFPSITFLQQRGALAASERPSCKLLPPSISPLLLPTEAGIAQPAPSLLGRANLGLGTRPSFPAGILQCHSMPLCHHPADGLLLCPALPPVGRSGLLSQSGTSKALKHPQSAVPDELLLAFLAQTASATSLFLCLRMKGW